MINPYTKVVVRDSFGMKGLRRAQARRNALIHLSVLLPTALNQPLIGVGIGVLLSSIIFIISMSRPIVRQSRDGSSLTSKRVWTRREADILTRNGTALVVFDLEGPLFFGNAEDLAGAIKAKPNAKIVILNLRMVADIDATGLRIVEQINKTLAAAGRRLLVAEALRPIAGMLQAIFLPEHTFPDIDDALEFAERALIGHVAPTNDSIQDPAGDHPLDLASFDICSGASPAQIALLESSLNRECLPAGALLCREGDEADRLWLIRSGAVSVRVGVENGGRRIAAFGPGTTVGEMAIVEGERRSASMVADEPVEAYVLTLDAYRAIMSKSPEIGFLILRSISRTLSRRLRATSVDLRAARGEA
jgi:CRP-like cAMP-binding protein